MFLKLVNSQFPELFDVTTLLLEEGMATSTQHHRLRQSDRQMLAEQLIKVSLPSLLDPKSSPPVIEAFKNTWDQLNSIMPHEIWALTIHALLPQPLMNPRSIITPTSTSTSISISTESATGRPLPLSHQIVKRNQAQKQLTVLYTFDWLVQDPLLLFKVDFRTFRSPMIFRLFIQVLSAVMTGSRHWYRKQLQIAQAYPQAPQQGRHPSVSGSSSSSSASAAAAASASNPASLVQAQRRQFKEANLSAMLYIQDSALVQLLLEICEARPEDLVSSSTSSSMEEGTGTQQQQQQQQQQPRMTRKNQKESSMDDISNVLKEVRIVTFNFLHQLFIDHKIFPKLVHFQGYAMDLLPAVVAGVDSIHVCLDFLQEILFSVAPSSMLAMSSSATSTTPSSSSSSSSHLGGGGGSGGIGGGGGGGGGGGIDLPEDKPDVAPQVFALRLAAHLCERFPLQNTMQMTIDFILPRFQALAISTGFAKEVLESAVILAKAFPSLRDDIVSVLR
ncbi:Integrator complex subunit 2, partial [Lobosporangium transversale]